MTAVDESFLADNGLNTEDTPVPEGYPIPMLWRVLIMPVQPRKQTRSGIILAAETQDAEKHLQYIGRVVDIGPLAGRSEKFRNPVQGAGEPQYLWGVKPGDYVVYGRYAGQRCEFKGVRLLFLNDDEILATATGPEGFRVLM